MEVLLVPNYSRPDAVEAASTIEGWLSREGVDVMWAHDKKREPDRVCDPSGAALVISFGGDGTLLRAAQIVGYREIPILGLSFGHLGFLTGAGSDDIVATVASALAGEMHASRRATLEVDVDFDRMDGTPFHERRFALNELALTRGALGDMVEFEVSVSGNHIDKLRGDGFVVSTATGSTGYALSSGGPIVTPEFDGMVCVPIAPHTILARAFLTSPSDVVELDLSPERPVERSVFVDGQIFGADCVARHCAVRRGPGDVILLDAGPQSFYSSVSRVFYGSVRR
ncbi:MAG: NAD(+)/NADH kinase [Atopobiaceae bacterium]|jgi:NAD+ kinase|nr:NAD(+)/NADH kinase [Atopobiaceae bacterium]MCH4180460.1 NAD(+)/NADH kinase [Atopobiaceae bacterium]MCH4214585.1 NAD(+)/NADH kinase [Atopobiaceae bacterium]MCH4229501.1 NAD(+)/NADH kinase [Atopobiaceae bacterium]MCH4275820.1 NAD(+)/NADH kinase [Atopobiaceae bacterium]